SIDRSKGDRSGSGRASRSSAADRIVCQMARVASREWAAASSYHLPVVRSVKGKPAIASSPRHQDIGRVKGSDSGIGRMRSVSIIEIPIVLLVIGANEIVRRGYRYRKCNYRFARGRRPWDACNVSLRQGGIVQSDVIQS